MELEDLKSAWKAVPEEKTYNKQAIFEMMKNKSSSIVKWLFIFTLVEFLLVLFFTCISLFNGKLINGQNLNSADQSVFINYIIGSIITILFTLIFLAYTFISYRKININNTIVDLMNQIVGFRKTINYFIIFIVISLIYISIPYYFNLGKNLYIEKIGEGYDLGQATTVGYIAVAVALVFILVITALYYGFIYFVFLRKLKLNLKALDEIK